MVARAERLLGLWQSVDPAETRCLRSMLACAATRPPEASVTALDRSLFTVESMPGNFKLLSCTVP